MRTSSSTWSFIKLRFKWAIILHFFNILISFCFEIIASSHPLKFNYRIYVNLFESSNISQKQPIKALAFIIDNKIIGKLNFGIDLSSFSCSLKSYACA